MIAPRRAAHETNRDPVDRLSSLLVEMADPDRLSVVVALREGDRTLEAVVSTTGMKPARVLLQLTQLCTSGFVKAAPRRGAMTYRLARPDMVDWLLDAQDAMGAEEPGL